MNDVITTVEQIRTGDLSWDDLAELARHDHQSIRGAAIHALMERFGDDDRTINLLRSLALEPRNRRPFMGTISLAHVCMKYLLEIGGGHARAVYEELLANWPADDRDDLEWFIRNG